jgi:hypothetical protein
LTSQAVTDLFYHLFFESLAAAEEKFSEDIETRLAALSNLKYSLNELQVIVNYLI